MSLIRCSHGLPFENFCENCVKEGLVRDSFAQVKAAYDALPRYLPGASPQKSAVVKPERKSKSEK